MRLGWPVGSPGPRQRSVIRIVLHSAHGVVTVRVDEKTRRELDQVVEELRVNPSDQESHPPRMVHTMQDRNAPESAEIANDPAEREEAEQIASGPVTLLRKGSIFLITLPPRTVITPRGPSLRRRRDRTNFIGSVVTVAPPPPRPAQPYPARSRDRRPEMPHTPRADARVDITKLNNWIGVLATTK